MKTRVIREKESDYTQIAAIRDLMLAASPFDDWLTLAEIAEATEFGEASISAQLRNLRKPQFGKYRVEKRRRLTLRERATTSPAADGATPDDSLWEYCVFPSGPATARHSRKTRSPNRGFRGRRRIHRRDAADPVREIETAYTIGRFPSGAFDEALDRTLVATLTAEGGLEEVCDH